LSVSQSARFTDDLLLHRCHNAAFKEYIDPPNPGQSFRAVLLPKSLNHDKALKAVSLLHGPSCQVYTSLDTPDIFILPEWTSASEGITVVGGGYLLADANGKLKSVDSETFLISYMILEER
jgi:hypothetical protein